MQQALRRFCKPHTPGTARDGLIELERKQLEIIDLRPMTDVAMFNPNYLHLEHEDDKSTQTLDGKPSLRQLFGLGDGPPCRLLKQTNDRNQKVTTAIRRSGSADRLRRVAQQQYFRRTFS